MYERFTERAKKVMQLANQEAHRLHHDYIGTEHVLLGLVKEGRGVASRVLKNHHIDLKQSRFVVDNLVPSGPDIVTFGKLPLTPRYEQVIEASLEEARNFNQNLVGTEHILLGLLQDQEGIAAIALRTLGLNLRDACNEVIGIYAAGSERSERRSVVSADNFCRRLGRMVGSFGRRLKKSK